MRAPPLCRKGRRSPFDGVMGCRRLEFSTIRSGLSLETGHRFFRCEFFVSCKEDQCMTPA
jgi:hypothetical protein